MINNDIAIELLQDMIYTSCNLTENQKEILRNVMKLLGANNK